jgi:septum formation protein
VRQNGDEPGGAGDASRLTLRPSRFYLASRSPRRRELLAQTGYAWAELPAGAADVDETPQAGEAASAYVERIARAKAAAGWQALAAGGYAVMPVLTADTTVVVDDMIIGKPADAADACAILRRLAGRAHRVLTAVALAHAGAIAGRLSASTVEFRDITAAEIERYVESGEPFDKAGAYGIQGRAAVFVRAISGSYSGIMGLPLFETAELLGSLGITPD